MSQRALITGATGFVGYHLTRHLLDEGWTVVALARPSSNTDCLERLSAEARILTIEPTAESVYEAVAAASPDCVFHLASLFLATHTPNDVDALVEANISFGCRLLEGMRLAGCRNMINAATSWQHFHQAAYNPVCLYAATKEAFVRVAEYYRQAAAFTLISLTLFDTYGPLDRRKKILPFLLGMTEESPPLAMSPGDQLIDLVYIGDVTAAFIQAAELAGRAGCLSETEYAVTSGNPIRLKTLVNEVARLSGRRPPVKWGARPYRDREVMTPWNQGTVLPGWHPEVSLEEGLRRCIESAGGGGR
ncbi:MAG: NAD(P)-dependent oxidoreductase [Lentisphaeria bacterium]|nr:NAD(P)-dependent oxidoreductase [Lentisphaeria bacterium]